jgi:hypothetical protein
MAILSWGEKNTSDERVAIELEFDSRIENPLNPLFVQQDDQLGQTEDC